jgi:hypothetical protein
MGAGLLLSKPRHNFVYLSADISQLYRVVVVVAGDLRDAGEGESDQRGEIM